MADELFSVEDQVVLISGASRGIGLAIASGFAARGAKVVITGRVAETVEAAAAEICPPDGTVLGKTCDVADPKSAQKLVDEVVDRFGPARCEGVANRRGMQDGELRVEPGREGRPAVRVLALGAVAVGDVILTLDQPVAERPRRVDHAQERQGRRARPPGVARAIE